MEKIWKALDDESFNNYEEYEKSKPDNILNYYGEKLEEDTNNLLTYEIINTMDDENNFKEHTSFYCQVPKPNPFYKETKYSILLFTVSYTPTKIYPCRFRNSLSKEVYVCESVEELKNRIEKEIKEEQTKNGRINK